MTRSRVLRLAVVVLLAVVVTKTLRVLRGPRTDAFEPSQRNPEPTIEPPAPEEASPAEAEPNPPGSRWVFPDGHECPPGHQIKAKLRSGLYHLPGMLAYDRTNPDRCYATEVDAIADGLTRAKR